MRDSKQGRDGTSFTFFKWSLQLLRGEWIVGGRAETGKVCAVVHARGVDGVGKVVAGKMETSDTLEAEQL